MQVIYSFVAVLLIVFIVPILIYGLFSALLGLEDTDKKLGFFVGVLVQKLGTAGGFVGLMYYSGEIFITSWWLYSLIWLAMYALTELGQVLMSEYTWKEAAAGVLSEAIYFPLAGVVAASLLR